MLAVTETIALEGVRGRRVTIETDISRGLPYFTVIGLGDAAVKEAAERVRRALINSGFDYPKGRITVNLSPAYIHKRGSHYDLGIAAGILLAGRSDQSGRPEARRAFIGELALDGRVLGVRGVLAMVLAAAEEGFDEILLPEGNCAELSLLGGSAGIRLIPVRDLRQVDAHLRGEEIEPYKLCGTAGGDAAGGDAAGCSTNSAPPDFADVRGQRAAKEAIAAAMAGGHSLLLLGPPGAGKTMLARRAPGLLPPLSAAEQLEVSAIYSAAGMLSEEKPFIRERPFRQIDKTATRAQLLGGGSQPLPGEVSYAHKGVLFADELLEMDRSVLEALRLPLEEKSITITRGGRSSVFPADFLFIAAANPCRCGFLGDERHRCTCTAAELEKYRSRFSGPLADRIDMGLEILRIAYDELGGEKTQSSAELRQKVSRARAVQAERFSGSRQNVSMTEEEIARFCRADRGGRQLLAGFYRSLGLSPRRYYKLLRLARTLADMDESEKLREEHLALAFQYTRILLKD